MTAAAPIQVRPATVADVPALLPLFEALGYPVSSTDLTNRLLALAASDPSGTTLVASAAGQLLGFATLHATPVLHRPTPVGRITGIAVADAARGRGVGRLLVIAAETYFVAQGLGRVEVTSGPTHLPAHDFYRHLGYEDQGIRFAKPLRRADS